MKPKDLKECNRILAGIYKRNGGIYEDYRDMPSNIQKELDYLDEIISYVEMLNSILTYSEFDYDNWGVSLERLKNDQYVKKYKDNLTEEDFDNFMMEQIKEFETVERTRSAGTDGDGLWYYSTSYTNTPPTDLVKDFRKRCERFTAKVLDNRESEE